MLVMISLAVAIAVTYLLVCLMSLIVAKVALPEGKFGLVFGLLAALVPPIAVWALLKTIFVKPKPMRYHKELAAIEDEIEAERVTLFGGKLISPSVSQTWERAYLRYLAETTSSVADRVSPNPDGRTLCTTTLLCK